MTNSINELKSYTEYNVNAPTSVFTIGFQYEYNVDHVNVYVDGVEATAAGYTIQHDSQGTVQLTPAVPSGVVRLSRETDIDTSAHTFSAGAKFTAGNMDENFEQIRHSQQEVRDGFSKLSDDTYAIIDTLQDVGQAAQDAADAAEQAAITANNAAAQVNDKVSYQDLDNAIAATPHNTMSGRDAAGAHPASAILDASGETQQQINYKGGVKWHSRAGGYQENERVVLANGDIVKSTVANNTVNPNVDMTGWILANDASQIKFKHTALFSVMRSLSDRLTDIASVKDFGAVGDGVTDDSAAINAAYESGAGIIIFPAGSYLIKSSVFPKSNTHTIAPKAKIIYYKHYSNLTIEDAYNVTIEGLTIDGNQFEWEDWWGCGLNIFKSESITITGCEIYNAANSGINVGQVSVDPNEPINSKILIDNCYIHDIGTPDISSFYAYGNGIAVVRGKDVVIRNNFIDKIYDIGGINLEGLLQDNIIVEGNRITNLTGNAPAIKLWAGGIDDLADYVIIRDNIISNVYGGGNGDWGAIHVKSAGNSLTIDNNKIYDCQSDGIVVNAAMDLTISNNVIKNSSKARLNINTASKVINITGNYVGYADGATAQPSWIETQGVTGSIANISNNTVENAPGPAFRLVFRNPSKFTNNTIIRPNRSSGYYAIAFGPSTLGKSIIGNNSFIDPEINSNRFAFYDFSGNHPDMVYLPDSWDIVQGQRKFDLTANNAFIQSCIAIKTSPPTEGYNEQGRILYNADPAANAVTGWMCTASGTPGTWKSFGQLA